LSHPKKEEKIKGGSFYKISWVNFESNIDNFRLLLSQNGGISFDDTIAQSIAATNTCYNWNVPALNSAQCRIMLQAVDAASSVLCQSVTLGDFTIDSKGPTIELIGPDSNAYVSWPTTMIWHAIKDSLSGVSACSLFFAYGRDMSNLIIYDSFEDTSYTACFSDTVFSWQLVARDSIGNRSISSIWSFEVDHSAPEIPRILTPVSNFWTNDTIVSFSWSKVDKIGIPKKWVSNIQTEKSSPVNYTFQLDTTNAFQSPVIQDSMPELGTTLCIPEGRYWWRVSAYDLAGNQGAYSPPALLGIDLTPPKITFMDSLPSDSIYPFGPYSVSATVFEQGSLSKCWLMYKIDNGQYNPVETQLSNDTAYGTIPIQNLEYLASQNISYYAKALDKAGNADSSRILSFTVSGNYIYSKILACQPNPFIDHVNITYCLGRNTTTKLSIYDIVGRKVDQIDLGSKNPGFYMIQWHPKGISAGIYFCTMHSMGYKNLKKIIYLK
jgi:hypothetical protein